MSNKARLNYALDAVIALAFILSSLSGIASCLWDRGDIKEGAIPAFKQSC
jgi:hypothetical protein